MKVRSWPVAAVGFALLWLFVRGVPLERAALLGQFLFGLAVGLPVAFLFRRLYAPRIDLGRGVRAIPYTLLYGLTFGRELLWANVDVAYRVLAPGSTIDPDVISIPLRVETPVAITLLATSITITPGTVTLDHQPGENALFVHVIDGRDLEATVEPIRRWESYALEMFDEAASPDDPAPEFVVHGGEDDE